MNMERQRELSDRLRRLAAIRIQAGQLCQDKGNLEFICLGVDAELAITRETMSKESDHSHGR